MYTNETVKKVVSDLKTRRAFYENIPVENIAMCISGGNMKIGRVLNVSLPPVLTCGNCAGCKSFCYDIKACYQYKNTVVDARARNLAILEKDRAEFFKRIEDKLSRRRKNKFFRWHVAGDIVDYNYFENMVRIAANYPDFTFWTYTKMYHIVNMYVVNHGGNRAAAIPGNLHILFSEWDGMPLVNPFDFPIFTCRLKGGNKNHDDAFFKTMHKCPGNCDVCKAAGRGCPAGESSYADEH